MKIKAEIVKVSGMCNASFQEGDVFTITDLNVISQHHQRSCTFLCSSIIMNTGRLRLENKPLYISCQDPGTGEGGNVIVKLSAGES